jgi:hypothetical protein
MRALDNLLESPTEPRVGYGSRQGLYSECDLVTVVAARLRIGEGRFGRRLEILRPDARAFVQTIVAKSPD